MESTKVSANGATQEVLGVNAKAEESIRWIAHSLLIGGFAMLILDIRFEHREAVGDTPLAWIPIVFSGVMIFLIPLALMLWKKGGKQLLAFGYGAAILVGLLGCFFHANGHFVDHMVKTLVVWQSLVTKSEPNAWFPPFFAPLAFDGLGSIGLFFTFQDEIKKIFAAR